MPADSPAAKVPQRPGRLIRRTTSTVVVVLALAVLATTARFLRNRSSEPSDRNLKQAALSRSSRVGIQAFGCGMIPRVGAGVTVANHLVLTDAHVVAGSDAFELLINGSKTKGVLVHLDPNLDLALLRVSDRFSWPETQSVPFGRAQKGDKGWVTLLRNEQLSPTLVRILRPVNITTEDIYVKGRVTRSGYELQGNTRPGDSGAAVLVDGKVVGLLWSRSQLSDQRAWLTDTSSIADVALDSNQWRIPKDTRCR